MIPTLIDKQDSFEIVRDEIAAILALETANQQALATAAGKDPELWKLRVYTERSNPWEAWLNSQADSSPIVNVWFDTASYNGAASDTLERQMAEATYNVDVYGLGISASNGTGHVPGDQEAAEEAHRAARLVRNILMAAEYAYLGQRGLVGKRWPQSLTSFQPQMTDNAIQQVVAVRLAFVVQFNEFAPQVESQPLELLSVDVKRAEDGAIVAEADFDYTGA